jgi:hypothetical protein
MWAQEGPESVTSGRALTHFSAPAKLRATSLPATRFLPWKPGFFGQ